MPAAIEIHIAVSGSEFAADTRAAEVMVSPRTMRTEPRTNATVVRSRRTGVRR
jgi:hypothetical protein